VYLDNMNNTNMNNTGPAQMTTRTKCPSPWLLEPFSMALIRRLSQWQGGIDRMSRVPLFVNLHDSGGSMVDTVENTVNYVPTSVQAMVKVNLCNRIPGCPTSAA
jgi:hypothetical protein